MIHPHQAVAPWSLRKLLGAFGFILLAVISLFGCAKLPLDNEPPGAPILVSDGISGPSGVAFRVLVDDPDGDRITLQFQVTREGSFPESFNWTSFFASGEETVFFLSLVSAGQWTVTARARDELNETSPPTTIDLLVSVP